MSKETEQLIDAFGDAVSEHGWPAHWHPQKAFDRRAALLAHIERIERERVEALKRAAWLRDSLDAATDSIVKKDRRIAELKRERDEARTILAHTDIGSLPNDWTLKQVAEARIDDLMKLRDQVRDTCARAEKAERRTAELTRERDGYYNEAAEGWGKFREAERRIAELEKACQQYERNATEAMALASQRGARLQILRDRITPPEWYNFVLRYPEAAGWFDEDGVPVGAAKKS